MHRFLLGAVPVQSPARQENGLAGRLTRGADRDSRFRPGLGGRQRDGGGRGHGRVELGSQALDQPRGLLAAGGAQVQPFLIAEEDRVGVVGAGVAALAAVLLRHGGHQTRRERPASRHAHALGGRDRRVVPGCLVVGGQHRAVRDHRGARQAEPGLPGLQQCLGRRDRPERRCEEARKPHALLLRERRRLGHEVQAGNGNRSRHATTSAAARARRWLGSWRRAKAAKPSAASVRWAM